MITASFAWKPSVVHRTCWPMTALATPPDWKIHFHSSADTAVGIAHGTRMLARTSPRPRKARCMTSAIARPRRLSMTTVTRVKYVVFQNAFQNRWPESPVKMAV